MTSVSTFTEGLIQFIHHSSLTLIYRYTRLVSQEIIPNYNVRGLGALLAPSAGGFSQVPAIVAAFFVLEEPHGHGPEYRARLGLLLMLGVGNRVDALGM
jgi:hypothetical protein